MILTKNGAGFAYAFPQSSDTTIYNITATAGDSVDLKATLYLSNIDPVHGSVMSALPADAQKLLYLKCPQKGSVSLAFPGGLQVGECYIIANFVDAGTDHEIDVFTK